MKIMALSKDFFHCGWNIFDLIIVSASLLDLIFELVDGLSVLRGLRLVCYSVITKVNHILSDFLVAPSVETGPILDHHEGAAKHHHQHYWSVRKPYFRLSYSDLHFCRYWHATVCQRLH